MAPELTRFQYAPLGPGEIRLLHSSSEGNAKLTWSLKTASVYGDGKRARPKFDALSYTWGDQTQTFVWICNGGVLRIHKNLHDALPFLARRRSRLPIWVDAVCINQADESEKRVQIRLMHQIYHEAAMVWVWLGCASEHTHAAINLLPTVARVGQELKSINVPGAVDFSLESRGLPAASSPVWPAIYHIMCNNWYTRLWICQEAALAQSIKFLVGEYEIPWHVMDRAMQLAYELFSFVDERGVPLAAVGVDGEKQVFLMREVMQQSYDSAADLLITILVLMLGQQKCFDPRDRVLGLLGFARDERLLDAVLQDGLSTAELYISFCRYLLLNVKPTKTNWWEILNHAMSTSKRDGLPSWCPDLHHQTRELHGTEVALLRFDRGEGNNYAAATGVETNVVQEGSGERQLIIRGSVLDTVTIVHPELPEASQERDAWFNIDFVHHLGRWEKAIAIAVLGPDGANLPQTLGAVNKPVPRSSNSSITLDGYWQTLMGGARVSNNRRWAYEDHYAFRSKMDRFISLMERDDLEIKNLLKHLDANQDKELLHNEQDRTAFFSIFQILPGLLTRWRMALRGRRLFSTSSGRFGIGPASLQETDRVCISNSARTAHILRGVASAGGHQIHYSLVGEAYVHGMMDGEIGTFGLEPRHITLI